MGMIDYKVKGSLGFDLISISGLGLLITTEIIFEWNPEELLAFLGYCFVFVLAVLSLLCKLTGKDHLVVSLDGIHLTSLLNRDEVLSFQVYGDFRIKRVFWVTKALMATETKFGVRKFIAWKGRYRDSLENILKAIQDKIETGGKIPECDNKVPMI
jgi:hypothetical protein